MNSSSGDDAITPTNHYLEIENEAKLDRMNRLRKRIDLRKETQKTPSKCVTKNSHFLWCSLNNRMDFTLYLKEKIDSAGRALI